MMLLLTIKKNEDALMVAEKVRHTLNQPFELAGQNLSLSSSIGIAIYPEHGSNEIELTKNADSALYLAKDSGRDNVKLFHA